MITVSRLSPCFACLCGLALGTLTSAKAQPAANANASHPSVAASHLRYPQVNLAGLSREYRPIRNHATKTDEKIRVALAAPCQIDVAETPLRDVIASLREESGLPIVIDVAALNNAGHDPDTLTVTYRAPHDVSLRNALRQLLSPLGLTYIAADEVLTVTTLEESQNQPIIVSYPLPRGFGDSRLPDMQPMIDLIQSTVAPITWDCAGGMGTIRPLEASAFPLLVVLQTSDVHDEIETLLRGIHERLLAEFADGKPAVRVHRVASAEARSSLAESLKDVCNDTLGEAGDPDATVKVVGDSMVVLSKSPEFHAVAGQVIAAVGGVAPPEPRRRDPSAPDIAKPL